MLHLIHGAALRWRSNGKAAVTSHDSLHVAKRLPHALEQLVKFQASSVTAGPCGIPVFVDCSRAISRPTDGLRS